jgi:hypothetical protein
MRHQHRGMTSDPALDPTDAAELLRLLQPVAQEVEDAVRHPPSVARDDWLGPAADACADLEHDLRGRLGAVLAELDHALDTVRRAL